MDFVNSPIIGALIGIFIGAVIGFIIPEFLSFESEAQTKKQRLGKKIMVAVIGAVIGHLAILAIQTQILLVDIKKTLSRSTPYDAALKHIEKQDGAAKDLFIDKLEELKNRLLIMSNGEILVPRDEVFNVWIKGFELMTEGDAIYATNIVSENDWKFFGPEGGGRNTQNDAILRGVKVQRIMLFDPNDSKHKQGLYKLAELHKEVGVEVKELNIEWLETPAYQGWLQQLGTSDIVLFGDQFVLLTFTNPKTKNILRSEVTTNREKIEAARAFYKRIWNDSRSILKN